MIRRPDLVRACVPPNHREIVNATFDQYGIPVLFEPGEEGPMHGGLEVAADREKCCAFLRVASPGAEPLADLRTAVRLLDQDGIHATYLDLPLSSRDTPGACRAACAMTSRPYISVAVLMVASCSSSFDAKCA